MPTPWRLLHIDIPSTKSDEYSESYRKKREQQISKWRENNFSSGINNNFVNTEKDAAQLRQLNMANETRRREKTINITNDIPAPKLKSFETYKTEKKEKTNKILSIRKKSNKNRNATLQNRVQKAKDNFTRNHKTFLVNAIEKYKPDEKDIHLDIPNLNSATKMSYESLSFPKEILQQLGDQNGSDHNGKLCNLEAGWLPRDDLDQISDDDSFHILPYHIKQPKTMDERQKERIKQLKKLEKRTEKKKFDPAVDFSYLFA
jgi:hypothetical protein